MCAGRVPAHVKPADCAGCSRRRFLLERRGMYKMNTRLLLLGTYVPPCIKRARMTDLFARTAAAFDVALPDLSKLTSAEILERYACFVCEHGNAILGNPRTSGEVRRRLYEDAVTMGLRLRSELRIRSYDEVLVASRIFYRILGIEFSGDADGNITIRRCFFSKYFSAAVCGLISALDEGVAQGLSGGSLKFSQRITDGSECCRATMAFGH